MYLSRIKLNLEKRETLQALSSPGHLHGAVESAFPDRHSRKLWRLDPLHGELYLLILSDEVPDVQNILQRYSDRSEEAWLYKPYAPLLDRVQEGSRWHFRLVANPTQSIVQAPGQRGKVCACSREEDQRTWLEKRAAKHGFGLTAKDYQIIESRWHIFSKGQNPRQRLSLLSVSYEGRLQVCDAEAFKKLLINGIGRGKAYGMGLLTIAQPQ